MTYEQQNYSRLLGIQGLSDILLTNHFSLYGGYVKNTNLILEKLKNLEIGSIEFNELNRRFSWEFNGMRLHELYFENLSKENKILDENSALYKEIVKEFGSFEKWQNLFKNIGLTRGIGWVLLVKDRKTGLLINTWVGEHNIGNLCDQEVLLVMDVWEHSYMNDYGIKRIDYVDVFLKNIDWNVVVTRF
ncbi:MAG: Fe-Mn family superoxide dismutase [Candidatus Pacebacteria bacterium]|nr:Fe-Mn family superoxide dismutase [Candidatus Paceibacterota bacterium]